MASSKRSFEALAGDEDDPIILGGDNERDHQVSSLTQQDAHSSQGAASSEIFQEPQHETVYKTGVSSSAFAEAHRDSCDSTTNELIPPPGWAPICARTAGGRFAYSKFATKDEDTVCELSGSGNLIINRSEALDWLSTYEPEKGSLSGLVDDWCLKTTSKSGKTTKIQRGRDVVGTIHRGL
ncbi:uncharacterized protein L199_003628 [Kwoniella botswanensis]|uniref:uncharacterized protein n=1 Tax=Kwoniella botswanensis TaxID=1268659 RepID=UPI00315CBC66